MKCKHCEELNRIFDTISSNQEYYRYTELFVYLHGGADHCDSAQDEFITKKVRKCITESLGIKPDNIKWRSCQRVEVSIFALETLIAYLISGKR